MRGGRWMRGGGRAALRIGSSLIGTALVAMVLWTPVGAGAPPQQAAEVPPILAAASPGIPSAKPSGSVVQPGLSPSPMPQPQAQSGPSSTVRLITNAMPTLTKVCTLCITSITSTPVGDGASVRVITNGPAFISLQVAADTPKYPNPLTVNDFLDMYSTPPWFQLGTVKEQVHIFQVGPLQPAKHYSVTALANGGTKALDAAGNNDIKFGSFNSLHRNVQWLIHRIHILDDSDALGSGELNFQFHLDAPGRSTTSDVLYFDASTGDDIEVDETEPPFVMLTLKDDTSTTATVIVHAVDDDSGISSCYFNVPHVCTLDREGSVPGLDSCGQDGSDGACATAVVTNLQNHPQDGFPGPLDMQSSGHKLSYQVFTTLQVTFTP